LLRFRDEPREKDSFYSTTTEGKGSLQHAEKKKLTSAGKAEPGGRERRHIVQKRDSGPREEKHTAYSAEKERGNEALIKQKKQTPQIKCSVVDKASSWQKRRKSGSEER